MTNTENTSSATAAAVQWLGEHHGVFCANSYTPRTAAATERVEALLAAGLVHRTPRGRYGLTAAGADAVRLP